MQSELNTSAVIGMVVNKPPVLQPTSIKANPNKTDRKEFKKKK